MYISLQYHSNSNTWPIFLYSKLTHYVNYVDYGNVGKADFVAFFARPATGITSSACPGMSAYLPVGFEISACLSVILPAYA